MKKCAILFLLVLVSICFGSANVLAFDSTTDGTYSIASVTIEPPPGGATWDASNPAQIVVGETYTVNMEVNYADTVADTDPFHTVLSTELEFNNSGKTFYDTGDSYINGSNATYLFVIPVTVSADMADDTAVDMSFAGGSVFEYLFCDLDPISLTGTYDVNVTGGAAPVPEPASILLIGLGLAGLVGFSKLSYRRKKLV